MVWILAQLSSGGVSAENLGIFILAAAFLSKWAWDYKRASREDTAAAEPKANPPLHKQFVTREEFQALSGRFEEIGRELRSSFIELDRKRSVSIAGLHDDLSAGLQKVRDEMKSDNGGIHNRITEMIGLVRELKGKIEA